MKCDLCKVTLTGINIGYVRAVKGKKVKECKKCHRKALKTDGGTRMIKAKKLNSSWMLVG